MKITRVGTRRNEERPSTPGRSFPPYKYEREPYDQDVHEKNVLPVEIKNVLASQVVHFFPYKYERESYDQVVHSPDTKMRCPTW